MEGEKAKRYYEIDMLKGLACYLMMIGHAMRARPSGLPADLSILDMIALYAMDFSGPMFFIASGMNVCTFWDRNKDKAGFSPLKFYTASAAVLFLLGYTYNFSVLSIVYGVPDIFQCVAICTAVMMVLTSFRSSAGVYLLAACAVYAVYLPFRTGIVPTKETILALPILTKQFFTHFGFFPWAVFFFLGGMIYRTRSRVGEIVLTFFFLAMIGGSFFVPQAFFHNPFELMFRGVPGYVLQTGGTAGLVFLLMRHYYSGAGKSRFLRGLEFAGLESFLFLILHFFLIIISLFILPNMGMYARASLILAGTALLLPVFARLRDRLSKSPRFVTNMLVTLVVCFILGIAFSGKAFAAARIFAFAAAFAFAFVFGELRARLRRHYTKSAGVAASG